LQLALIVESFAWLSVAKRSYATAQNIHDVLHTAVSYRTRLQINLVLLLVSLTDFENQECIVGLKNGRGIFFALIAGWQLKASDFRVLRASLS